ncbi:MAG TPA: lipopolysaccharide biosynthesis protein, partial [Anaeromyxobacteraceae bacterium]|nr:lipopolysaccharide biosynthesis protein [Anaeromyxobacteraceae bacterium]
TPEANESNLRSLSNLGSQIDLRLAELADARRRRTALIASLPEPTSGAGFAAGDAADVLRRLQTARAAYGPDHPDVKRLERQYLDASARDAEELKRFQRDRLDTQSERLDAEIREQEQAIRDLKSQSAAIQRRLDAAPRVAEEYRARSRDYETIRAKYTTTLARASDARAAEALLAADSPLLFRVVESAALPSTPAGPNRLDLMLAALAAALGAGLLAVACAEYFDSSLRGPQDADSFGVSVLASIPRIGPARVFVPR